MGKTILNSFQQKTWAKNYWKVIVYALMVKEIEPESEMVREQITSKMN